jgi:hypothetical protein
MKQPEALRLAETLDAYHTAPHHKQAAAELRRLHEVNIELLEALNQLVKAEKRAADLSFCADTYAQESVSFQMYDAMQASKAAIAKATGEQP